MTKHEELQEKFPFLTGIEFNGNEFVGIVQNQDAQIISFYDIEKCRNDNERRLMLEHADLWWWESNRMLPIDVFLFCDDGVINHLQSSPDRRRAKASCPDI